MTFWFFATPIIYSMQDAPPIGKTFLNMNPFTHLAVSYQEILFYPGNFGHWKWLLALGVASVRCSWRVLLFDRLRDTFAEEVYGGMLKPVANNVIANRADVSARQRQCLAC